MLLQAINLHKSYGQLRVLKGIDLSVGAAEVLAIVGQSGAGKSTLLHILGSLDRAEQGTVLLNGVNLSQLPDQQLSALRGKQIGFVFQFHNLLPEFTALENVCLPAFIAGKSQTEAQTYAQFLMEMLGIWHRKDHKPSELSGGEQQRTAIARALINQPAIVFADEPSGNLDTKNADELHHLFFKLRAELGQTFVIVTHNPSLANMADRKVEMVDGKIDRITLHPHEPA